MEQLQPEHDSSLAPAEKMTHASEKHLEFLAACSPPGLLKYKPYFFHVHITREPDHSLGISLDEVNKVVLVQPNGMTDAWNTQCEATFPDDMIRVGDVIWEVNDVKHSVKDMRRELKSAIELLILVCRGRYVAEALYYLMADSTEDETPAPVATSFTVSKPLISKMDPHDDTNADPPEEMLDQVDVHFIGSIRTIKDTFGFVRPDPLRGHNFFWDPLDEHDLFFHKDDAPFGHFQQMQRRTQVLYTIVPIFRNGSWQFKCAHVCLDSPPKEMLDEISKDFKGCVRSRNSTFGFVTPDRLLGHSSFWDPSPEHDLFFHKDGVPFGDFCHMQQGTRVQYSVMPAFRQGSWQFRCEHVCLDDTLPSFRRLGPENEETADPPPKMVEQVSLRFTGRLQKIKDTYGFVKPDVIHSPSGEPYLFFHRDAVSYTHLTLPTKA